MNDIKEDYHVIDDLSSEYNSNPDCITENIWRTPDTKCYRIRAWSRSTSLELICVLSKGDTILFDEELETTKDIFERRIFTDGRLKEVDVRIRRILVIPNSIPVEHIHNTKELRSNYSRAENYEMSSPREYIEPSLWNEYKNKIKEFFRGCKDERSI
jgi:hypothetical protein